MTRLCLIIMFAFIHCFVSAENTTAQDSTSPKYFPLKVGNVWVYDHYWGWSGHTKLDVRIIDSLLTNSHKYFKIRSRIPPPGTGYSESYIRIDSTTGNVRYYDTLYPCAWLMKERNEDSLMCHWPDSCSSGCSCCVMATRDTIILVLGQPHLTKGYVWGSFESFNGRQYAKDIGIYYYFHYGPAGTSWQVELLGCVINGVVHGDTSLMGIRQISSEVPEKFSLSQNYPNPFNPVTLIKFEIPNSKYETNSKTEIRIYDVLGKEIATLVNENLSPGTYEVEFDGTNYPSGVYYYILTAGEFKETRKMVLIK